MATRVGSWVNRHGQLSQRVCRSLGYVAKGVVSAILPETGFRTVAHSWSSRVTYPVSPGLTAQSKLSRSTTKCLWVPSREPSFVQSTCALVMLSEDALVDIARSGGGIGQNGTMNGYIENLKRGRGGDASGQFLLDSEASLKGVVASSLDVSPSTNPSELCMRPMVRSLRSTTKKSRSPTVPSRHWVCQA